MSKFKILIFINALGPGGAERQVVQDANLLIDDGHQVTVCFGISGPLKNQLNEGVSVIDLNTSSQIRASLKLYAHLKKEKYDLVFSHMFWANKIAALATAVTGHRLIQFEHGLGLWRKWYHLILVRIAARRAAGIITCSNAGRILKIQREGLPENAVTVIPNSFKSINIYDKDLAPPLTFPDSRKFTFAFCGRFNAVKQLPILIELTEILKEEGFRDFCFLLIGDGEQKRIIEDLIIKKSLQENFYLTGYVQNPYPYIKRSNCFVLPSRREDFSLALLEASHCGLPCIAFNVGGNSEIIEDGKTGYVISPYDLQAMASKLMLLLKHPDMAIRMGNRAKIKVENEYSDQKRLNALSKLIGENTAT